MHTTTLFFHYIIYVRRHRCHNSVHVYDNDPLTRLSSVISATKGDTFALSNEILSIRIFTMYPFFLLFERFLNCTSQCKCDCRDGNMCAQRDKNSQRKREDRIDNENRKRKSSHASFFLQLLFNYDNTIIARNERENTSRVFFS